MSEHAVPLQINVRVASKREISYVVKLLRLSFPEDPLPDEFHEKRLRHPAIRSLMAYTQQDQFVGAAVEAKGEIDSLGNLGGVLGLCRLEVLAVIPEYRGRKVGHQLLCHGLRMALSEWKSHSCALWAIEGSKAQELYKKFNFQSLGRPRMPRTGNRMTLLVEMEVTGLRDPGYLTLLDRIQFKIKKALHQA